MFKAFGHKRASVLNGGLPAWESYGLHIEEFAPGEAGAVEYPVPTLDQNVLRGGCYCLLYCNKDGDMLSNTDYSQMVGNAGSESIEREFVVDARSTERCVLHIHYRSSVSDIHKHVDSSAMYQSLVPVYHPVICHIRTPYHSTHS